MREPDRLDGKPELRGSAWRREGIGLYNSSQADEPEPQTWHRHMGFLVCGFIASMNEGVGGKIFFPRPL